MAIPDPWEEQRRRARAHRRARRRRWWWAAGAVSVGGAVAATIVLVFVVDDGESEPAAPADSTAMAVETSTITTITTTTSAAAPTTVPSTTTDPGRPVEVAEVWLLDRGDGDYDWGLTVRAPEGGETRSEVAVRVRLVADDGEILQTIERVLDGVDDRAPTAVAGRFVEADGVPARLDFEVTVGVASDDPGLDDLLETRAVEREGDELRGRIRSSAFDEINDVAMVLVWRDDDAAEGVAPAPIIDVVVYEIERLRPELDARFVIDLADLRTPDGLPDDVFWAPTR